MRNTSEKAAIQQCKNRFKVKVLHSKVHLVSIEVLKYDQFSILKIKKNVLINWFFWCDVIQILHI